MKIVRLEYVMMAAVAWGLLSESAWATVRVWKDPVDGLWNNTNCWSPAGLPAGGDELYITNQGSFTVSLNTTPVYASLTVGGESGTQSLNWITGTLPGFLVIEPHGTLNLVSNTGDWILSGTITNQGQVVWVTGSATTWTWNDNSRLENLAGGVVEFQVDGTISRATGNANINNAGIWRKSVGSGTFTFPNRLTLTNAGLFEVKQGTVSFANGFTSSGTIAVATNAAVKLAGGVVNLLPSHAFTGNGYYGVSSGGVTLNGILDAPNFQMDGGILTLNADVRGNVVWNSGTLAGGFTIATNGILNIVSNFGGWLLSGSVTNLGQIIWQPGSYNYWEWSGAHLRNEESGLVDIRLNGSVNLVGTGQIDNRGIWRKSLGTGNFSFPLGVAITNFGLIDAVQGVMTFPAGFVSSGMVTAETNASVRLTGGTVNLLPGHAFTGVGYYGVPSGGVTLNGSLDAPNFRFDGGILTMNNTLDGALYWTAGTLTGTFVNNGLINLISNSGGWILTAAITNEGQIIWAPGSFNSWAWNNARLENGTRGLVDVQVTGTVNMVGTGSLINQGTWRKSVGTGTFFLPSGVSITNNGIMESQKGILTLPVSYVSATGGLLSVDIRDTNDYGRIAFAGPAILTNRFNINLVGGFRPPVDAGFSVLSYPSFSGCFFGFKGIDLDDGLRLDPRLTDTGVALVATTYSTQELAQVYISRLNSYLFLWWPVALTNGWDLHGKTNLAVTTWTLIPSSDNNRILPDNGSNIFFQIRKP